MNITLPSEMASMVKPLAARVDDVSESEVIREGLRVLPDRRNTTEYWLRGEVAATYDAYKADPTRAKPLSQAWKDIEAMMDDVDRDEAR